MDSIRVKDVVISAATDITVWAIPRIPDEVKRLLLGLRSITIDGNTLDTTLQLLLAMNGGRGGVIPLDDVAAARARLDDLVGSLKQDVPVSAVTDISIPGPEGTVPARHYRPFGDGAAMLVFFHGGGYSVGTLDSHDDLCRKMCRDGGLHVLSVDYRLAPEHKFPAGLLDAFAAYRWVIDNTASLGVDAKQVAVGGDSAGGTLATAVARLARNEGVPPPALQLLIYPGTTYVGTTRSWELFDGFFVTKRDLDWFRHNYLDGVDVERSDPRISPLLADDLAGLPPALVLVGGFDPMRDEVRAYADALRAAGVVVDYREFGSLVHGFANFFSLGGDSAAATAEMISAVRAHLSYGASAPALREVQQ